MAIAPGPVRRMMRSRARIVAVALLALVSLTAAGINATAAERLQALLDDNWRGAYDILVTGGESEVAGLLAPNSVSSSVDGLTLDDVAAIRKIGGVEVAAPIGEVIIPMLSTSHPQFTLPKGHVGANETPQAFRVTVTYLTDDGLGERLVSTEIFEVVVDEAEREVPELTGCNINGFDVTPEEYPMIARRCSGSHHDYPISYPTAGGWGADGQSEGDSWIFSLGNALMSTTRVTLVDPAAERALLGEAGEFLRPLEELSVDGVAELDAMLAWTEESPGRFADDFLRMRTELKEVMGGTPPAELEEWKRLHEANGAVYEEQQYAEPPYVPILARATAPAPLTLRIDVESFGDAPAEESDFGLTRYTLPEQLTSGAEGIAVGSTTVDASVLLNPFSTDAVLAPWPETSAEGLAGNPLSGVLSIFITGTAEPPHTEIVSDNADGVEIGLVADKYLYPLYSSSGPGGAAIGLSDSGTRAGIESVFAGNVAATARETSAQGAVVGGFTLEGINGIQSGLAHVPLGAYEPVGSTLIAGSSDAATEAIEMRPSVSGLGLVSPETVAIASLESATVWGQKAPVNAVRVRVGDVAGFSTDAVANIASVAGAIEQLGFTATVVAGSSPTDVTVHVDGYAFGVTSPDEEQTVGLLGAVTQRWSELGAAARADLAVSTSSMGVLAVALGASALLLAAVQLASVPGRRAQAAVMRNIGWPRQRIVRWMAAEELVALIVVVLAGLGALALAGSRSTVGLAVGASVAALVVTSALAVGLGARPAANGIRPLRRSRRRHRNVEAAAWVVSPLRFAVRQLGVHRINVIVQLLATVVVGVAASAVTVTVLEGRAAAGGSALGVFAVDQALWAQLGLALVALVAGVVLAVIARRIDLGRRQDQWATMRAMGWSTGQVRSVQITEGLIIGIPAIAIAGALAWAYVRQAAPGLLGEALTAGLAAATALTAIVVMTSWRERQPNLRSR